MTKDLTIKKSDNTPDIVFKQNKNELLIQGNSYPEDAIGFYKPVKEWLFNYLTETSTSLKIVFRMNYFNTSSAKIIIDLLRSEVQLNSSKSRFEVIWKFQEDDEEMKEVGERFEEITGLIFQYKPLKP